MPGSAGRVKRLQEVGKRDDDNTTRQLSSQGSTIRENNNSCFHILVTNVHIDVFTTR
jgi:hypothetical protein